MLALPGGMNLRGLVQRVCPRPLEPGDSIILTVHDHEPGVQDWKIYYSVLWGDYELQQIRIQCKSARDGGTKVVWMEQIAGFGSHGVGPVSEFVQSKYLESRVFTYRNAIEAVLNGSDPGEFNRHLTHFDHGIVPREKD